tara:strand:+ start:898 stop:1617 length:720 start_codon:yes stop_codon:yes gene_type:complete
MNPATANNRTNFILIRLPVLTISIFFICFIIASLAYPGSSIEHLNFETDKYSITHNFLSDLGRLSTTTGVPNTTSAILFNGSLVLVGLTLILFYRGFHNVFVTHKDSAKSIQFSRYAKPVGLIAGILFAGVGIIPLDLHFGLHVFCANYAFLTLFVLSVLHSLTVFYSKKLSNHYAIGYMIFCVVLLFFLYLVFFGPRITPGTSFSEADLMLQVISQKSIVLTLIVSLLAQVYGLKRLT